MKSLHTKAVLSAALLAGCFEARGIELFSDNFNVDDTENFDGAPTSGRLGGTASAETSLQAFTVQQAITGGALDLRANQFATGGVRFGGSPRYDWAGSTTGADILAAGGFTVSFDWSFADNTSPSWVGFAVGTADNDAFVIDAANDHALLLRMNGQNERFDNRANLGFSGNTFTTSEGANTRKVLIKYLFDSFADGTNVNVIASVDGQEVVNDTFQWDGNLGALRMELAADAAGHLVDNLVIATAPGTGTGNGTPPVITAAGSVDGSYHISFNGEASTTYNVRGSTDLQSFPIDHGTVTTDTGGAGDVVIPLVPGEEKHFYRIEEIEGSEP
ncbi:hypothetical protein OKA04_19340 [Luteolibacter flavescens]|uniref:Uncharacterized protein n=1 Tax=Luteolibacter flavescens TaxID=1859460 RepID=A0ABT3FTJ6_9BACT|nr:hypothetical protein [Luteolibacter flavescens]MCW1886903.1 hypothetical protein [Luteolibacter flavescens]